MLQQVRYQPDNEPTPGRAERKAGELLQQLERATQQGQISIKAEMFQPGIIPLSTKRYLLTPTLRHDGGNQYTATSQPVAQPSQYAEVLEL